MSFLSFCVIEKKFSVLRSVFFFKHPFKNLLGLSVLITACAYGLMSQVSVFND